MLNGEVGPSGVDVHTDGVVPEPAGDVLQAVLQLSQELHTVFSSAPVGLVVHDHLHGHGGSGVEDGHLGGIGPHVLVDHGGHMLLNRFLHNIKENIT